MSDKKLWVLPDRVSELTNAMPFEYLRRQILDQFHSYGYELVLPPLLEFLDALLIGSGNELDLEIAKITDQLSGRLLGLRADITPQITRIASNQNGLRFCYSGDIFKARNKTANRIPMQIGAELFGHSGLASDIEIIKLMLDTLKISNISGVCLDLGHVGIFKAIISQLSLTSSETRQLVEAVQRKSKRDTQIILAKFKAPDEITQQIIALLDLHGGVEILAIAKEQLNTDLIGDMLDDLSSLSDLHYNIHYDLSELRGFSYHTGLVFATFVEQSDTAISKGGRYDNIGQPFGKARPATGFSADLLELFRLSSIKPNSDRILAPDIDSNTLQQKITELRQSGQMVVQVLPGNTDRPQAEGITHQLVLKNNQWQVVDI